MQYRAITCIKSSEVPVSFQPLLFTIDVKTSSGLFRGQRTHNAIIVITQPPRCPKSEIVSSNGRIGAPQVFRKIVITTKPSMMSVYCQLVNAKSEFVTSIIASIRVTTTNSLLAIAALKGISKLHTNNISDF